MLNPSISTSNDLSTECSQDLNPHWWNKLLTLHQVFEHTFEQEKREQILLQVLESVQDVLQEVRNLPEQLAFSYFHSREALQKHLVDFFMQIQCLRDESLPTNQARRFAQILGTCRTKLAKALEQGREPRWKWPAPIEQRAFFPHMHSDILKRSSDTKPSQGRLYQSEFHTLQQALALIARLFYEESEIWPDQCMYTLAWLYQAQSIAQETCAFLDGLSSSRTALSADYCPLVVSFHHIRQQMHQAHTFVARYRAICRSSSSKTNDLKQTIANFMQHLCQENDACLQKYMHFLDQAHFQEHRVDYTQVNEHFA